ncbi:putative uncharacterized protein [Clostridium sp. CAG:762]|nr:putative uncharacterized protein [Clostridium sp. CAG:762]
MRPRENTNDKINDFKGTIVRLVNTLKKYKIGIIVVIIFSIISAIFSVVSPKILGKITTEIATGVISKFQTGVGIDFDKILHILIILIVIYLVSAIFTYFQSFIMAYISNNYTYELRKKVIAKMNKIPLKFFESKKTGDILSRITNDIDTIGENLNQSLTQIISSFVMLIGIIMMMLSISPLLTGVSILILPIGILLLMFSVSKSQKYFNQTQEYLGHINSHVEEVYGGHSIVKAYNGEEQELKKFENLNDTLYNAAWKGQFLSGLIHPIMNFLGNLGYVIVAIIGGYLTTKGKLEIGYILSFSQYVRNFNTPIMSIAQIFSLIQSMVASSERVFEFLDVTEEVDGTKEVSKNVVGNIEFDNVSFGYDKDKIIIHNFNATIKKGQKVAIVGPTGAGKTTIVKLLMRFYDVNDGVIKLDGIDIRKFKRDSLRSIFGMVLQDTWLFNGTVKENISYGKLNASIKEIEEVGKASYIDHFIKTNPLGYDMQIDEETSNISAGQKQLLTIARVILKDPKILILDEATSNVDTRTEILIQKAMDKLMENRTSFIIAHRLSTIKNADLILVMNDGNIVEVGKHKELLKKNGFYASIYNSQFENN